MPELPEVEVTRRGLEPYLTQQIIERITLRHTKLRYPLNTQQLALCAGQTIQTVQRRAKYLLLYLTQGVLIIHLGMSGRLSLLKKTTEPGKHDHIDLILKNQTIVRYNDPRRFGVWLYTTESLVNHRLFVHLGPEPLTMRFNAPLLYQASRNKSQCVKNFIMDNRNVVGVGNIYASESLFLANIHPAMPSTKLNFHQCLKLVRTIRVVLQQALLAGGTSFSDFLNAEQQPGLFVQQLKVYGRAKAPCVVCNHVLEYLTLGGRRSVFCPHCQNTL